MISQNPQQMLGLRLMAKRGWMLTKLIEFLLTCWKYSNCLQKQKRNAR